MTKIEKQIKKIVAHATNVTIDEREIRIDTCKPAMRNMIDSSTIQLYQQQIDEILNIHVLWIGQSNDCVTFFAILRK